MALLTSQYGFKEEAAGWRHGHVADIIIIIDIFPGIGSQTRNGAVHYLINLRHQLGVTFSKQHISELPPSGKEVSIWAHGTDCLLEVNILNAMEGRPCSPPGGNMFHAPR